MQEKRGRQVHLKNSIFDQSNAGLVEFKKRFNPKICLVVGDGGMSAIDFLSCNPKDLF